MTYGTLLFDGMNIAHRAAHVAKPLTTEINGIQTPIGCVYQTIRIILSEVDRHGASGCTVIVAWEGDEDGKSWRRDLFPGYKANRLRHDDERRGEMRQQVTLLRAVLSELGWAQAWSPGFEADDTLATLAARLEARGSVGIVTGDRDLHQCVTARVHVIDRDTWNPGAVREKWSVSPMRIPEIKAIAGDASDGIPGVKGLGDKYARELVSAFDSLEDLFSYARDKYDPEAPVNWGPHIIRKLLAGEQDALLFRTIATVSRDAPLEFAPRGRGDARAIFERYRFSSLLAPSTLRSAASLAGR